MRVLDAGCGPGSITIGLAEAVGPDGEAIGIDRDDGALVEARALAAERQCTNVRFEEASVYGLPFADGAFDATFAHMVFQHLGEPQRAMKELRRVVKPGGVIGIGDADHGTSVFWPTSTELERSFEVMRLARREGDVNVGRKLRGLMHEAGFVRCTGGVNVGATASEQATVWEAEFQARWFEAPESIAHVGALGLADKDEMRAMAAAWRAWGANPGAFWAKGTGWAVGWV